MNNALIRDFAHSEAGSGTAWGLMLIFSTMLVGGYALDVSNVITERTRLQMAADTAAHTALVARELNLAEDAIAQAVVRAQANLDPEVFGNVLSASDVVFGTWDSATRTFTPNENSNSAVRVTLNETRDNGNAINTYLLHLAGIREWDLETTATFETYSPTCLTEGFVSEDVVDIQSNNNFFDRFCIHSNTYVSMNSNNYFEPGTVVSMPDTSLIDLPNSGFETNEGLQAALRSGSFNIRIIERIDDIINLIADPNSTYYPDYITNPTPVSTAKKTIATADLPQGRIINWNCAGGKGTISNGTMVKNVVIKTSCEVKFGSGVVVENSAIVTTNTSDKSFNASAGFQVGKDDACAPGGGSQLVTLGGMNFASSLQVYGSQLLAVGNIEFAARADGIEGASMVSGGTITGTSNMSMSYCGSGMDNFEAAYFRMVD